MSSRLDAIKARAEAASHANHTTTMNYNAVYSVVWRSHQDIPALVAAVEAALATHAWNTDGKCPECWADYPCNTVTAIRTALGEGEK